MTVQVIPDGIFISKPTSASTGLVPRTTLKKQKKVKEQQLQVCATGKPLRYAWGRNRVGAALLKPVTVVQGSSTLYLPWSISRGPIDSVLKVQMGDDDLPDGASASVYLGLAGQGIDPTLQAAWAAHGKTYVDTLPGIAWGWCAFRSDKDVDLGNITIEFQGLRIFDTRDATQAQGDSSTYKYSANSGLVLADFITNAAYGRGEAFDWQASVDVFDNCDELVGGKPRRETHLCISDYTALDDVEEILRAYAGCWVVREGGVARLVADAPATSVYSFGAPNTVADSLTIEQTKRKDTPTVVTVQWTDTSVTPWKEQESTVYAPGIDSGVTPWREEVVSMPGIHDAGQAVREALRRLNEYITSDLTISFIATDDALQTLIGDVFDFTDEGGFTTKLFRLTAAPQVDVGRWRITGKEYDDAIYSDAIATGPSNPDTTLPSPASPPMPTGMTIAEEIQQGQDGYWASRLRATWADMRAVFPFVASYSVVVKQADVVVQPPTLVPAGTPTFVTGPLKESLPYVIEVAVVSVLGVAGPTATASITTIGKSARPGDLPFIAGFEVGGDVALNWGTPVDLDVRFVELRYGPVGAAWEAMTLLDRVAFPGVRYLSSKVLPAGTWDIAGKALDSVRTDAFPFGQESLNAVRCTITVTSDASAFVAGFASFSTALLDNMVPIGA